MKKKCFNQKYGLEQAVLEGRKTMFRDVIKCPSNAFGFRVMRNDVGVLAVETYDGVMRPIGYIEPRYRVGEIVAIAQAYKDLDYSFHGFATNPSRSCGIRKECAEKQKGWGNKMFVEAKFMPHHINITDIKVERLQEISNDDCLKEGIDEDYTEYGDALYWFPVSHKGISWEEYKKRSYELSCHELNGEKGDFFWESPQKAFATLIDKVSGKGIWERNPWVFAYSFELVD